MGLTELTEGIRSFIKWAILAIILLIFLWFSWRLIYNLFNKIYKPGIGETAYGKLAPPFFTKNLFNLNAPNIEGSVTLPNTKKKAAVYQFKAPDIFTKQTVINIQNYFKFTESQKKVSGNSISWEKNSGIVTLNLNTSTNQFSYRINYARDLNVLKEKNKMTQKDAIDTASEILKKMNIVPNDLTSANTSVKFLRVNEKGKTEVTPQEANSVEVGFYRKIDGIISTGDPPIRILIAGGGKQVIEMDYYYLPILSSGSLYPIITAESALDALKKGEAYTEKDELFSIIIVKNLYLSYWESRFKEGYLQPIWVFELEGETANGKENIKAYLPAIDPNFLIVEGPPP